MDPRDSAEIREKPLAIIQQRNLFGRDNRERLQGTITNSIRSIQSLTDEIRGLREENSQLMEKFMMMKSHGKPNGKDGQSQDANSKEKDGAGTSRG